MAMKMVRTSRAIGRIVKERRVAAGLTQKKLAKKAGVSERLIIALELGDRWEEPLVKHCEDTLKKL